MNYQLCIILGLIAAIILTIVTYVLIMPASKNGKLNKFCQFLHNFFNFKKIYLESVLKFFYVLNTIGCVTMGFFLLFGQVKIYRYSKSTFLTGLLLMILGPIFTRLFYEILMLTIIQVKNIIEINNKINSKSDNAFANGNEFSERFSKSASSFARNVQQQFNNNNASNNNYVNNGNNNNYNNNNNYTPNNNNMNNMNNMQQPEQDNNTSFQQNEPNNTPAGNPVSAPNGQGATRICPVCGKILSCHIQDMSCMWQDNIF